ncbi:hypothetical protein BDM02DRAFT_3261179 [Thelephora ganbajun]|uniref:Uncharacterized protein n=1 Tax=Thelephora ganbajun TaxID=370292 RepID=A0ACB6ZFY1_THEGA|nr:hypothetical protein BDM02DRAFT_3261179 [Thelephora ganbajun]
MSSSALKDIIDLGHDVASLKYYKVAVATIFFYDYLLTLADEASNFVSVDIRLAYYLCQRSNSLGTGGNHGVLAVGIPALGADFGISSNVPATEPFRPPSLTHVRCSCVKTAFFSVLAFVWSTLLAQVVLTLRIYAITGKNRMITVCLGIITMSQFTFGLYGSVIYATHGARQILPIPLDTYRICTFEQHVSQEIVYTTISLVYDFLVFSVIIYLVARSNVYRFPIPSLLKTIAQDATLYFLVIFTSHLMLELTLLLGRPSLQVLPAVGNVVYLPVMITRLMLSLRKANASQECGWSLGAPTAHTTMAFAERRGVTDAGDEVHLDTYASGHEGTQSQT